LSAGFLVSLGVIFNASGSRNLIWISKALVLCPGFAYATQFERRAAGKQKRERQRNGYREFGSAKIQHTCYLDACRKYETPLVKSSPKNCRDAKCVGRWSTTRKRTNALANRRAEPALTGTKSYAGPSG
jgi:hypothetical protein